MSLIDAVVDFNDSTYRNIVGINVANVFDDLTADVELKSEAYALAKAGVLQDLSKGELQYNAIDFIFNQHTWHPSRFSNGLFPIWYSSLELETTFYETVFHWRNTLLADVNFFNCGESIYTPRTIFKVECACTLIDLRQKTQEYPYLTQTTLQYSETQKLGARLYSEGLPGIITLSARKKDGQNLAVFNKNPLHNPTYEGDYMYEVLPDKQRTVKVFDNTQKTLIAQI